MRSIRYDTHTLATEIGHQKKDRNAMILAHNYQAGEIQDIADIVGDSLELSRAARIAESEVIVFCGVDFMAETAAILSPEKIVLLPAVDACCPMAKMISAEEIVFLRKRYPDAAVVCYINSTAAVKAESDICCTSSNAVQVVNSLDHDQVLFVPDQNLGRYVARFTDKKILPWEGFCIVHDLYTPGQVLDAKKVHPGAKVVVHPECRPDVIDSADFVGSTSGIIRYIRSSPEPEFIVGTEVGILHRLSAICPEKRCYPLSDQAVCRNMKKTTWENVHAALEGLVPRVTLSGNISTRARRAIDRMLAL